MDVLCMSNHMHRALHETRKKEREKREKRKEEKERKEQLKHKYTTYVH